jgi:beta-galactosidase
MSFRALRVVTGLCAALLLAGGFEPVSARQRLSIDAGWRFTKGDPAGAPAILLYDIRPELKPNDDAKAADTRPEEAVRPAGADQPVLKPWILPSGNAFIRDPAKHFQRLGHRLVSPYARHRPRR